MKKKLFLRPFKLFLFAFLALLILTQTIGLAAPKKSSDTTPPTAPGALTATAITTSSVSLKWTASYDKKGVASYLIYKNSVLLTTITGTTYTASALSPATTYTFSIKAKDTSGNFSASSNVLTVTTAAVVTPPPTTPTKIVVGYYANWSSYSGYTPANIPAQKLTNIHYAFAKIGDDFKIALTDPNIDEMNLAKLIALKTINPNLKLSIAIGGWDDSGKFSDAVFTDATRATFADSIVAFLIKYKLDGVDIDWEYPVAGGLATNIRRPEDKINFTLFMKTLREKLNARSTLDGKTYLLSFAGGAGGSFSTNTELKLLSTYVDYATIMTYDMHGTWDSYTDFNAPLYTPTEPSPQYKVSVDSAVKQWTNAGFPASKLVLGMPFYGYLYNNVSSVNNGLYSVFTSGSSVSYDIILSTYLSNPTFVRYYHSGAMVPWLSNGSIFISYDDAESIAVKAAYVKSNGLAGASVWELSKNKNGVLLDAIQQNLK